MNRTLLLILCDFLLLNMLAFTRWEQTEPASTQAAPVEASVPAGAGEPDDLVASMRAALEEEKAARERLEGQMRSEVSARDSTVRNLEAGLQQARQTAQELGARLTNTVTQANQQLAQLEARAAQLAQQGQVAQQQLAQAGARLAETEKARAALDESVRLSEAERRKLAEALAAEREAARRQQQAQQQAAAALDREKREAEKRASELAAAVKVAEAERSLLRENVNDLKQQVNRVQQEKERIQAQTAALTSGVNQLAAKSEELKQEIRDNTPVAGNLLFQDFLTNRVQVSIGGTASGIFSNGPREKETSTVLISDGARVAALVHVHETPYTLSIPGFGLDQPTTRLTIHGRPFVSAPAAFLMSEPRALVVAVDPGLAARAGVRVYPLSKNPFKFPEALLVSRGGKYFGEVEFRLDPKTPGYVRMKTRVFSRLFGEFSPSAGDLVIAKSGEILGLMVNGEYCAVITELAPAPNGVLDPALTRAAVGKKLEDFKVLVDRLPAGLQ